MNRPHFLIYYSNNVLTQTTPKDWARVNSQYFPHHNFMNANNTPTTDVIEAYLVTNLDFTMLANNEIVICYKIN